MTAKEALLLTSFPERDSLEAGAFLLQVRRLCIGLYVCEFVSTKTPSESGQILLSCSKRYG